MAKMASVNMTSRTCLAWAGRSGIDTAYRVRSKSILDLIAVPLQNVSRSNDQLVGYCSRPLTEEQLNDTLFEYYRFGRPGDGFDADCRERNDHAHAESYADPGAACVGSSARGCRCWCRNIERDGSDRRAERFD